jgi:hypothetical protein
MGTINFLLPADLSPDLAGELERAWVASPEQVPWPTRVQVEGNQLIIDRQVGESGYLAAPWKIDGAGQLLAASATVMERPNPYRILVELARGKLNQLRAHVAQVQRDGLDLSPGVEQLIRKAGRALCEAVAAGSAEETDGAARVSLATSYQAAELLAEEWMARTLPLRRGSLPGLELALGCRLSSPLDDEAAAALAGSFESICIAFPWRGIEPTEGCYDWSQHDALLDWADKEGLAVSGGPIIDFSASQLPDWLSLWERDLTNLGKLLSNYVAAVLTRYRDRIHRWHLTSAGNSTSVLSLSEPQLLWLTLKAARVARPLDSGLEISVGIAQPWSDYMARAQREQSALLFAETVVRELKPAALELELIMGAGPRGSYCRDLLDTSRLLDCYGDFGVPLRVTLGYPSAETSDPEAEPEQGAGLGYWHAGVDEATQADWAVSFAKLALCKPYVEAAHWVHFSDAQPHTFPHCGLLDASGKPKPALQALRQLREDHLR